MHMKYIVLQSIAPDQGSIIYPAAPDAPPVLIDDSIIRGETDEERAANVARLIALGVIAPLPTETKPARGPRVTTEE